MSIFSQIKNWILDRVWIFLEWALYWTIPLILYPFIFYIRISDLIRPHFCKHQFSQYDPDFCYKCGKTVKQANTIPTAQFTTTNSQFREVELSQ